MDSDIPSPPADLGPPAETQSSEVNTVPKLCCGQILPGHQVAPSSRPGGGSRPPSPPGSAGSFARAPLAGATPDSPSLPSPGSRGESLAEGRGSQPRGHCPRRVPGSYPTSVFLPPPVAPCGRTHGPSLGGADDTAERAGRGWVGVGDGSSSCGGAGAGQPGLPGTGRGSGERAAGRQGQRFAGRLHAARFPSPLRARRVSPPGRRALRGPTVGLAIRRRFARISWTPLCLPQRRLRGGASLPRIPERIQRRAGCDPPKPPIPGRSGPEDPGPKQRN